MFEFINAPLLFNAQTPSLQKEPFRGSRLDRPPPITKFGAGCHLEGARGDGIATCFSLIHRARIFMLHPATKSSMLLTSAQ